MTTLTNKSRDDVRVLLDTHADLCAALSKIGKRGISAGITTTNDQDDSDFVSVTIDHRFAREAVERQKAAIESTLGKRGIKIGA